MLIHSSLHECSSSPSRARVGSAESVVLPVPERPRSRAERPSEPSFALQWRGSMPSSGSM